MKKIPLYSLLIGLLITACDHSVKNFQIETSLPPIYPDYVGVTIPANIAPMNFDFVGGDYTRVDVVIQGGKSGELHINGKEVTFPAEEWKQLLESNLGDSLCFTLSVREQSTWKQYASFAMHVSREPIDYGIVYRKIAPGYEVYSKMGLYERNLSSYTERALIENTLVPGMCVNCHTFNRAHPTNYLFHLRGSKGGTLLQNEGKMEMLHTQTDSTLAAAVYPYWHPKGEYIVFSVNETRQLFHSQRSKRVEVMDLASDLVLYHIPTNELIQCDLLSRTDSYETYPAFSPDGTKLYFCSATVKSLPKEYNEIRYNLCSIDFDAASGTFGTQVDTLIHADPLGKSVSFPRPSYDGKHLLFTLSDYGNFSIWHREADLWMLNLPNHAFYPLAAANSDDTESYHNWSSNSRWILFSSRRDDGLYTRLYLAAIDEHGQATKPFMLPQERPKNYYDYSIYSYNVPDFVSAPVELNIRQLEEKIQSPHRTQVGLRSALDSIH
ncbi:MAG: TolB family protein [Phocaeicola sp.]